MRQATLTYSVPAGLVLETEVEDVSMNALIPADASVSGGSQDLVLSDVNGKIRLSRKALLQPDEGSAKI